MTTNKVDNVPDEVCEGCPQNYHDECRAFQLPHTEMERAHRLREGHAVMHCKEVIQHA